MIQSIQKQKPFSLFACCLLVQGIGRSLIVDVQRNKMHFIPNSLYLILSECNGMTLNAIIQTYGEENQAYIMDYFDFLSKEELIFFTNSPTRFPKLNLTWEQPRMITNGIIDILLVKAFDIQLVINQFSVLACHALQLRFFAQIKLEELECILDYFENTRIQSVELLIKYDNYLTESYLKALCIKYKRLAIVTVFAAPTSGMFHFQANPFGNIFFVTQNIMNHNHCGLILSDFFTVNIKTFTEAQKHNTCLNRKMSIDKEGYIRNCPSMKEHYGNIRDTTLQQALEHPDFKKYWNVNKDQIKVCQDCEFRYICTDCRAYVEDPQDRYSKPLKCGYNPYTCEWEEWSTNPLKQKAIDHYNLRPIL